MTSSNQFECARRSTATRHRPGTHGGVGNTAIGGEGNVAAAQRRKHDVASGCFLAPGAVSLIAAIASAVPMHSGTAGSIDFSRPCSVSDYGAGDRTAWGLLRHNATVLAYRVLVLGIEAS